VALDAIAAECRLEVWPEQLPPTPEVLRQKAADCDGLLSLLTDAIDDRLLSAAPKLRVVSNFAVGVNNIDIPACTRAGCWSATRRASDRGDRRHHPDADAGRRPPAQGVPRRRALRQVADLGAARLGRPGADGADPGGRRHGPDRSGRRPALPIRLGHERRLHLALAKPDIDRELGASRVGLDKLLGSSDFVSVHADLNAETKGMFGDAQFQKMKRSAVFVNAARGRARRSGGAGPRPQVRDDLRRRPRRDRPRAAAAVARAVFLAELHDRAARGERDGADTQGDRRGVRRQPPGRAVRAADAVVPEPRSRPAITGLPTSEIRADSGKITPPQRQIMAKQSKSLSEGNMSDDKMTGAEQKKAVDSVVSAIEKQYGKGAIMSLGKMSSEPVEGVSTGSLTLDIALGGVGIPKGRVIEIYGAESSGKTTIALHAIANCQKAGGVAAFIDAEHALDPSWAKKIGVKLDELLVSQPGHGEEALKICEMLVSSNAVDLIVIDSVAALVPKNEIEGEIGDSHVGLQARLMSQALRILTPAVARSKTCVIFINQIRQKVGVMYGPSETTSGGLALRFYASVRMEVRRAQQIKDGDEVLGVETKVKVVKNKVAPPFRTAEFELMYDRGISIEGDILRLGEESKILSKSGANFYYGDQRIGQGRENAKAFLRQNPAVKEEIRAKISDKIMQLNTLMEELPADDDEMIAGRTSCPTSCRR
jgi:recombination protein RecA